jgi:hypothetical protein
MSDSVVIPKNPERDPSEDYGWLRQKGLEYIEQLGSRLWTDYNIHDPGITLLELLSFALTDLSYRTSYDVADLLAVPLNLDLDTRRQGFFTAREILTINPWTIRDFRKLLIDIDGIKNGWLQVKETSCEGIDIYADCKKSVLQYSPVTMHPVVIKGLYDVMVEFEDVERMGNLNSGKVLYNFSFNIGTDTQSTALIEMRLPSWQDLQAAAATYEDFRLGTSTIQTVTVSFISGNKGDNEDVHADDQADALRTVLFVTLTVTFLKDKSNNASGASLALSDIPIRVWFKSAAARKSLKWDDLKKAIEDSSPSGLLGKYHSLVLKADTIMTETRKQLQSHRNLCEDYCSINAVAVEDIAVCCDIEVDTAADIEAVLAEAYYEIDQYFSPDILFYSLQQLLDQGTPVEDIFEGPALNNGFINNAQVDSTNLKTVLYTSDIINFLMDIPGVKAIRNFSMARYDAEGHQIGPAEKWEMHVTSQHQPRFYAQASKFLVFKNELPFLPDLSELNDVLQVIRGKHSQPKFSKAENDISIERGTYYPLEDYFPIQYQLPLAYGVGIEGLPGTASVQRVAQAKQLRAYLLFFEQMLVNYLAQLAHLSESFAIDSSVDKTYFTRFIGDDLIRNVQGDLYSVGFNASDLQELAENQSEFLDRRNRFLDHLLSRFGESFSDYALMLFSYSTSKSLSEEQLIGNKVAFLKDLPLMSHDRAKAFDYTSKAAVCDAASKNASGLSVRIQRVLGLVAPDDKVFVIEHLVLRPRQAAKDTLLTVCLPADCKFCGADDPYSFRLTVVLGGEGGLSNSNVEWRRFAETSIRLEVPAHLGVKVCWVSKQQLADFETVYCAWLDELAKTEPDENQLTNKLNALLDVFQKLKSVYPPATLHDCIEGGDENPVFLDQTIITSFKKDKI